MSASRRAHLARHHRFAVLVALAMALPACTSSDGGTAPTSSAGQVPAATDGTGSETAVPAGPVVSGWDIDAVLAADPDCAQPVTGEPLRVGFAADLSPLGAFSDGPASESAKLVARLINCSGGLAGRPVEVIVADVSGDALTARNSAKSLVDTGVSVILGPPFAEPGFRLLQVTGGNVPVLFVASTEPALGDDSAAAYMTAFNDTQQSTVAAEFALTQGWFRAVTFSSPGPYFGYNPLVFTEVFTANGGQVIKDYGYAVQETEDFTAAVAEMAAGEPPDVIFTAMLASQAVALREQLNAAGLNGVEILMSDSFEITNGYNLSGTEGMYHVTHSLPTEGSRMLALNDAFALATGTPPGAPSMVALGGDAMAIVANAYLLAQTTDPKVLGETIASLDGIEGVTGPISYNGTAFATKTLYVHKVVDGQATLAAKID